jgi:hypothetical protein
MGYFCLISFRNFQLTLTPASVVKVLTTATNSFLYIIISYFFLNLIKIFSVSEL